MLLASIDRGHDGKSRFQAAISSRCWLESLHYMNAKSQDAGQKPAFSAEDNDRMVSAVNEASPDVLWVGMTAPKQELWIARNRHRLHVKIAAAVGAVFDFYAGQVKRPHPFFQRHGLEWLPRLVGEPRRLWRRTVVSAPIFLWHVGRTKIRRLRGRESGARDGEGA